jgi:hypothetical protein
VDIVSDLAIVSDYCAGIDDGVVTDYRFRRYDGSCQKHRAMTYCYAACDLTTGIDYGPECHSSAAESICYFAPDRILADCNYHRAVVRNLPVTAPQDSKTEVFLSYQLFVIIEYS